MKILTNFIIFAGLLSIIDGFSRIIEYFFFPGRYDIGAFSIVGILAVMQLLKIAKDIQNQL